MDVKEFIIALIKDCTTGDGSNLSGGIVWSSMLKASEQRKETFTLIFPMIRQFVDNHEHFDKTIPMSIIQAIRSLDIDNSESWAIIRLMPFLPADRILEIMKILVAQVHTHISKEQAISNQFLRTFNDVFFRYGDQRAVSTITYYLAEEIQKPERIILFSAMAPSLMPFVKSMHKMIQLESPSKASRRSFNYYLRIYAESFIDPYVSFDEKQTLKFLLEGLSDKSRVISNDTAKTLGQLMKFRIFTTKETLSTILASLKRQNSAYFTVLSKYIKYGNDTSEICDVLSKTLRGDDVRAKSHCTKLIVACVRSDVPWIRELVPLITQNIQYLVDNRSYASKLFVMWAFDEIHGDILEKFVDQLFDNISKIKVATNLALLLEKGYGVSRKPLLSGFIQSSIDSFHDKEFAKFMSVAKDHLTMEAVQTILAKYMNVAMTSKDLTRVAHAVYVITRLIEHYEIVHKDVKKLEEKIVTGKLPALFGCEPNALQPPETVFFGFLDHYTRRFPEEPMHFYVNWVGKTPLSALKLLMPPIRSSLGNGSLTSEDAHLLVPKLLSVLSVCQNEEIISEVAKTFKSVWTSCGDLDNIEEILANFLKFECNGVTGLVFHVYGTTRRKLKVDTNVILKLIKVESFEYLPSLCVMVRNTIMEWGNDVLVPALQHIAEAAISANPDQLICIETLKLAINEDRALYHKVSEDFVNSRRKMTKFCELMSV